MRRLILLLALAAVLTAAAPACASVATVTVNGEPRALVPGVHLVMTPRPTEYDWRNGMVEISTHHGDDSWELRLGPPQGRRLRRGVYDRALPLTDQTRTRPFMDLSGAGRGCDTFGRFEVKDVRIVGRAIKRLWLVYEAHCGEGDVYGMFGEVRIGEPARGTLTTVPRMVRWPASDARRPTTFAPVVVRASRVTHLGRAAIAGSRQFRIRSDDCHGRTLAAGQHCVVTVRYRRTRPGTRRAKLRIRASGGRVSVPLEGFAYGGTTRMVIASDEGDFVGQGAHWRFTLPTADVLGGGGPAFFALGATRGEHWFESELAAPPGGRLRPGTYTDARRYPFNDSHPGFDTGGDGRGCDADTGSFRVKEARYDRYHLAKSFAATLVQHCEGAKPALRATLDWRAGDHARKPPWMPGRIVTRR